LVDSGSNGGNVPGSVSPYASDDSFAEYRTQAVESLLPSYFTGCPGWKQEINEFDDRGNRGGQKFWSFRVMQEGKRSFQRLIQGMIGSAEIKHRMEDARKRSAGRLLFVVGSQEVQLSAFGKR